MPFKQLFPPKVPESEAPVADLELWSTTVRNLLRMLQISLMRRLSLAVIVSFGV